MPIVRSVVVVVARPLLIHSVAVKKHRNSVLLGKFKKAGVSQGWKAAERFILVCLDICGESRDVRWSQLAYNKGMPCLRKHLFDPFQLIISIVTGSKGKGLYIALVALNFVDQAKKT